MLLTKQMLMGVYATTDIEIICKNEASAKKVMTLIKKMRNAEPSGENNYSYADLEVIGENILLTKSSGRIQNLEYQCEALWKAIKDIQGVDEMNCPFMAEADGMSFGNN